MLKLNNMLENVYKQGRYTFAFAHYQVSFGNLRCIPGGVVGGGEVRLKIAVAIFLTPCY